MTMTAGAPWRRAVSGIAAPYAGMTQTGSTGLISAAHGRGTPGRWHYDRHFSACRQDARHAAWWSCRMSSCGLGRGRLPASESGLQPVGRAKTAPVLAEDPDRRIDLAHHDHLALAHVTGIALDERGPHAAGCGEA